ncbi:RCC1 domain-containing protein [Hyalangium gracile]|uniref:RCC1 domain-containing protein n=1 Tax=Hyalangium gracile TaxID=394092 RepID=UPI001CCDCB14|nr:RCC1 repeat-containing protein [Hyalangium gracile]
MTRTAWFAMELLWKVMMVLAFALGVSARAEPPLEPERLAQGSLEERQRQSARYVLTTSNSHSMVLGEGGSIWVWGGGRGEDLGIAPEYSAGSATPVRMPRMQGAVSVSTGGGGGHSLALMQDGTVQAWGNNYYGQLGDGTTATRTARVTVLGLTGAEAVAAGSQHSLAVRQDGTLWAWGDNWRGQLGDGTTTRRATPAQVLGLTGIVAVAASDYHSLALKQDGTVWGWGDNGFGQLGDGTQQRRLTPTQVPGLTDVVAIDSRGYSSYALRADGTVWAWGANHQGQLGDGGTGPVRLTPGRVQGLPSVVALAAGHTHVLALRADGTVWAWGDNSVGQLGNGSQGGASLPRKVRGVHGVVALAAAAGHSIVLRRNGTLWTWGHNQAGQMGTGTDRRTSPVRVVGLRDVRAVASRPFQTLAVRGDGSVWAWGSPQGFGGGIQATPRRVPGLTQAKGVAAGSLHALAVRQDGTVWAWGDNSRGQLGDGTVGERRDTPAPVQGLSGVVEVAAGDYHSLALKHDGTVWAWGANHFSQLGDMTLEDRPLPVQVQGLAGVAALSGSVDLSVAVKQDGTVWTWGSDWSVWTWGDQMPHPPAQAEGLSEVVAVSVLAPSLLALRADGTVWQWYLGFEGDQWPAWPVDGLTGAVAVTSSAQTTQILRADGTVWNTGGNLYGERGFPTAESYSLEPAQVPNLTGVVALSSESGSVHALRADGTLVSWGHNVHGTIGDGVSPIHLEPTRVLMPCRLAGLASGEDDVREQRRCHADD